MYAAAGPKLSGLNKVLAEKRVAEVGVVPVVAGAKIARRGRVVNLLALVDPTADSVGGSWQIVDNTLVSSDNEYTRLQIPYQPPEEYDFVIEYARQSGDGEIIQLLSRGGVPFLFAHGRKGADCYFGLIAKMLDKGNPSRRSLEAVKKGAKHRCVVQVRNDSISALFDGTNICTWKTDYKDMSNTSKWALKDHSLLGVASWKSSIVFHTIEVVEVTGEGKVLRQPGTK